MRRDATGAAAAVRTAAAGAGGTGAGTGAGAGAGTGTAAVITLHLCVTCRKDGPGGCASVRALEGAARRWASRHTRSLTIERTACLSGCSEGLMAMVELPEGMARIRQVAQPADIEAALDGAAALVVGAAVSALAGRVVSRVCWAEWDAE